MAVEPISAIASCIAIADLALKSFRGLYVFVRDARNADNTVKALCLKVHQLRMTFYNVHTTLRVRKEQLQSRKTQPEEERILSNIRRSLTAWRQTLGDIKKDLARLNGHVAGSAKLTWVDKALLQRRLQQQAPVLDRFERRIEEHIQELSLLLHCLPMYEQWGANGTCSSKSADECLDSCKRRIITSSTYYVRSFNESTNESTTSTTESLILETTIHGTCRNAAAWRMRW